MTRLLSRPQKLRSRGLTPFWWTPSRLEQIQILAKGTLQGVKNDGRKPVSVSTSPFFPQLFSYLETPHSHLLPSSQSHRHFTQCHHDCSQDPPPWLNMSLARFWSPLWTLSPLGGSESHTHNTLLDSNCHWHCWLHQWKKGGWADLQKDAGIGWEWWDVHAMGVFLTFSIGTQPIFFQNLSYKWGSLFKVS